MASSSTFSFSLTIAEIIDEAFERCLIDPADLVWRHVVSATRSMDLLFVDWANEGFHQWVITQTSQTLTEGDYEYDMPSGAIDVVSMVIRRSGIDTPMLRISRDDYLMLPDKDNEGMPDRYFIDRERDTPNIIIWSAPENSTDQIIYYYMRRMHDAGAITNTPDAPYRWLEAICAGLAAKLALKFAPSRLKDLIQLAEIAFDKAWQEDRDRSSTFIGVDFDRDNRS